LIIELDDLDASVVGGRLAVLVPQRPFPLRCGEGVLPQGFDGFVIDAIAHLREHDPRHFARVSPSIECFEPGNLFDDRLGDPSRSSLRCDVKVVGEEPEHALLLEAARELAHRLGMGVSFLGPWRRRAPLE
jgi:hypothetical protein